MQGGRVGRGAGRQGLWQSIRAWRGQALPPQPSPVSFRGGSASDRPKSKLGCQAVYSGQPDRSSTARELTLRPLRLP